MKEEYKHPAFPQPNNPGVNLWRYLDFDKFDWLLENNRLFMPSADRLGDPLEGSQPIGDLKWWQHQITNAETDEKCRIIKHNQKLILQFAEMFKPNYYVSCWHLNSSENKEMWRRYTNSAEAVAIHTTYSELTNLLPDYVKIGMVRYIDYTTERLPSLNFFEYITHKNVYYSFECEVRAVAFSPPTKQFGRNHFQENLFELETTPGFLVFAPSINIKYLVQEVVLHPEATSEFKERIRRLCTKKGLPPPSRSSFRELDAIERRCSNSSF